MENKPLEIGEKVIVIEPSDRAMHPGFNTEMDTFVGKTVTISRFHNGGECNIYGIEEDHGKWSWTDGFFKKDVPYYVTKLVNYGKENN